MSGVLASVRTLPWPLRSTQSYGSRSRSCTGTASAVGWEAVLDNAAWKQAAELVSAWSWPATQSAYSIRHFLILVH